MPISPSLIRLIRKVSKPRPPLRYFLCFGASFQYYVFADPVYSCELKPAHSAYCEIRAIKLITPSSHVITEFREPPLMDLKFTLLYACQAFRPMTSQELV